VSEVDIPALVAELRGEVSQRRRNGDYPQGLEHQMETAFAQLMLATDRHEISTDRFDRLIDDVATASAAVGGHPGQTSRVPGGSQVHAATSRLVQRHTTHLADRVREFGDAVLAALRESKRLADAQQAADQRQLVDILADVRDRLAVLDSLVDTARDLDERLAALEAAARAC
jgi:hypothetical protein